ncbi:dnaJ protein ERDJ3A [Vigna umbellata]|uniref:dnaJ protein ERDJ3A n=1 Tax=Vigna umbellata TaxID=87088 RepID=UPI001F5F06AB|nr:dnaJ protein ERDJ3A [Vigna umbellata]
MRTRLVSTRVIIVASLCFLASMKLEAKTVDPYKVLGVDKNASQREIQKAFHKLSLQYHPDKNKAKSAQEKFAQINNAYDILSDEEKRKNYDMYGDVNGNPGFPGGHPGFQGGHPGFQGGHPGGRGGYTYFTEGGPGQSHFNFKSGGDWQGGSKSFSFSSGGSGGSNSFGFGLDDIFGSIFGGGGAGSQFGGFGSSANTEGTSTASPQRLTSINSRIYKKEIENAGMTWILLSYRPKSASKNIQYFESTVEEVASTLQGAVKVGSINCDKEVSLCKELGMYPQNAPRIFVFSYKENEIGSLVEYSGHLAAKNLKAFVQEHLPRFSKRTNLNNLDQFSTTAKLPRVLLLSTKKDTPVIWRVLSGLFHKRIIFSDAQVDDVSDLRIKSLGVDALPSIVGWLPNGEKRVLKTGISVKDLKSAVLDLSKILDSFVEASKKEASAQAKKAKTDPDDGRIPLLSQSNFEALCGAKAPVCIIGAFRSSKAREKLESILSLVSKKSLSRRPNGGSSSSRDSISYALLDAAKHQSFLKAFDKTGYKSSDKLLIAYKPRRGKYSVFRDEMTIEEVENFVASVLSGDIPFRETSGKAVLEH